MSYRSGTLESSLSACGLASGEDTDRLPMNEEAFSCFYHKTVRPLWAYLSRISGDPALADDLVQESYLRFLCAKAPWEAGEMACRRYLFRIGTNLLRDHWRRPANRSIEAVPEAMLPSVSPRDIESLDSNALLNPSQEQLIIDSANRPVIPSASGNV